MSVATQMAPRAVNAGAATPESEVRMQAHPSAKRCGKCGQTKPPDEFNRNASNRDGLQSACRECHRAANQEWKRRNPEKSREQGRRAARKHPERKKALKRKWQNATGAKRAYNIMETALARGRLVRQDTCERCGVGRDDAPGGLHAHHDDYSKPLDVQWLCPLCHRARHRELAAGAER